VSENEIKLWRENQRYCDIADDILNLLIENGFNVRETRYVLDKAQTAVEASVKAARWGVPLASTPAQNTAGVWDNEKVAAEVKRRKDIGDLDAT